MGNIGRAPPAIRVQQRRGRRGAVVLLSIIWPLVPLILDITMCYDMLTVTYSVFPCVSVAASPDNSVMQHYTPNKPALWTYGHGNIRRRRPRGEGTWPSARLVLLAVSLQLAACSLKKKKQIFLATMDFAACSHPPLACTAFRISRIYRVAASLAAS